MPGRGRLDPSEIWAVGLAVAALLLLWSEQRVEEVAATPSNKVSAVCCHLAPAIPVFLLRSPVGLGGEGSSGRSRAPGGSGGSRSFSSSARVRGAGGEPVVPASPSSPLSASLGGEGIGDLVGWHVGSSVLFLKCGLRRSYCSTATHVHLAGRGGEEVVWSLPWTARAGVGPLWEPLEFRLSTALHPRRPCHTRRSEMRESSPRREVFQPSFTGIEAPLSGQVVSSPAGIGAAPARRGKPSAASLDPISCVQSLLGWKL
jgi:hypothetical protein